MGHGACRAQGSAQRARSGPYLHVAPPFRWWQRPTSTVHRSAASKPRDAGRKAAPGAAPPPASPGSGEPGRAPPPSREERLALPSQHLLERPSGSRDMAPFAVSGAVFRSQCLKSFEGRGSCLASAHSWGCRPRLRSAQGLPRVPKGSVGHAQGASWASRPSQVQGRTAVPSGTLTPADPAPSRLCRTQEAMSSAQAWGPAAVSASGLLLWTKVHFKQIWSRNL